MISKYLTHQMDWAERVRVMKDDLFHREFDYLYFKICLNLNDARDNADYDRENILKKLLEARRYMNEPAMLNFLNRLESIKD